LFLHYAKQNPHNPYRHLAQSAPASKKKAEQEGKPFALPRSAYVFKENPFTRPR
jgi:hypothetical protein